MHCGISGEVCEEPVLAKGSGVIYEKRVILKYLEAEGKDPATGEELTEDDLLPVRASKVVRPRPTQATSVPALIGVFQNEWDALMVETYTLKQHLAHTRKELTQALYQHDAACRVIARLVKERDEARLMLNALQSQIAQRQVAAAMDVDAPEANGRNLNEPTGITAEVLSTIQATCDSLSKGRKKRPVPEGLPKPDELAAWTAKEEVAPHQASKPGVLCLDVATYDDRLLVSGGNDKDAIVYDRKAQKVVGKLKGHGKKVTAVSFTGKAHEGLVLSGSADKTVRLWRRSGDGSYGEAAAVSQLHKDEVTGLSVHVTQAYFASSSKDKSWGFYDLSTAQALAHVTNAEVTGALECLSFHPDGVLLATGTADKAVRMWDVKTQTNVANFADHTDAVKSLSFSENGYIMASGSLDGTVRLWDLRKLKCSGTLEVGDAVLSVSFDHSGQYLGVAGKGVRVYLAKDLSLVADLQHHGDKVTAMRFQYPASTFIASASLDRTVKLYH